MALNRCVGAHVVAVSLELLLATSSSMLTVSLRPQWKSKLKGRVLALRMRDQQEEFPSLQHLVAAPASQGALGVLVDIACDVIGGDSSPSGTVPVFSVTPETFDAVERESQGVHRGCRVACLGLAPAAPVSTATAPRSGEVIGRTHALSVAWEPLEEVTVTSGLGGMKAWALPPSLVLLQYRCCAERVRGCADTDDWKCCAIAVTNLQATSCSVPAGISSDYEFRLLGVVRNTWQPMTVTVVRTFGEVGPLGVRQEAGTGVCDGALSEGPDGRSTVPHRSFVIGGMGGLSQSGVKDALQSRRLPVLPPVQDTGARENSASAVGPGDVGGGAAAAATGVSSAVTPGGPAGGTVAGSRPPTQIPAAPQEADVAQPLTPHATRHVSTANGDAHSWAHGCMTSPPVSCGWEQVLLSESAAAAHGHDAHGMHGGPTAVRLQRPQRYNDVDWLG